MDIQAWNHLTAAEGLFIALAVKDGDRPEYKWNSVKTAITTVWRDLEGSSSIDGLSRFAKLQSDVARRETGNKVWNAHWSGRVADMIGRLRSGWDAATTCNDRIMKLFLKEFETPMPESH